MRQRGMERADPQSGRRPDTTKWLTTNDRKKAFEISLGRWAFRLVGLGGLHAFLIWVAVKGGKAEEPPSWGAIG